MRQGWVRDESCGRHEWLSRRNCALTPAQLARLFGLCGLISVGVSVAWALQGAWVVLPFALIEVAALTAAFVVYGRHAADFDRIVIEPERVCVECVSGSRVRRLECQRMTARVVYEGRGRRNLIRLAAREEEIEVGRFVLDAERAALAKELRASLARR